MSNAVLKFSARVMCIAPLAVFTSAIDSAFASGRLTHHQMANHVIRPGKSLGPCVLKKWTSTLAGLKSCPPHDNDAALGHYIDRYRASGHDKCDSLRVYAVRDDTGSGGLKEKIEQVWTSSSVFVTSSGVRVGDGLNKVKRAYLSIALVDGAGGPASLYDDKRDGIAFEFRGTKCTAIIVHPGGQGVADEYMHIWE